MPRSAARSAPGMCRRASTPRSAKAGSLGPVSVELRGLFSGNVNLGRLYFRVYPEKRDGINMFHRIQQVLGCRETRSMSSASTISSTISMPPRLLPCSQLIDRWWNEPILRFQADALWLLGANDDLVLESTVVETLPLT